MSLLFVSSIFATVKVISSSSTAGVGKCECTDQLFELSAVQRSVSSSPAYFCGSDLNRVAGNNLACKMDRLYLCSTRDNTTATMAADIGQCPRSKKRSLNSCNDNFKSSKCWWSLLSTLQLYWTPLFIENDCLRNLKCSCRNLGRSPPQMICGQQLVGVDCNADVIYQCRLIGASVPLLNCPFGCSDGKCIAVSKVPITEVSMKELDKPDVKKETSSRRSRPSGGQSNSNNSASREDHEVEYVTFPPLFHIPLFNP